MTREESAWRRRVPCLLLAIPLLAACESAHEPARYTVRDSAGIRIVESTAPTWTPGGGWRISEQPRLQIGVRDGDEKLQLFRVNGAKRLSDGRIVVLNAGTLTLRAFSSEGEFLWEAGGPGDGPGEFRALNSHHVLSGDTILVWDSRLRRVSFLTPDGHFLRSTRLNWPGPGQLTYPYPVFEGRLVVMTFSSPWTNDANPSVGLHRPSVPLLLFDRGGEVSDTLGLFPGHEQIVHEIAGSPAYSVTPLSKTLYVDSRGSSLVIGTADGVEVSVWDELGGPSAIFRQVGVDLALSDADRRWYEDREMELATNPEEVQWAEIAIANLGYFESRPAFTALKVDRDGNVWIRTGRHFPSSAPSLDWTVFSSEGVLLGTVRFPEGFRVLEIGDRELIGVWTDDLGVEYLRAYGLEKGVILESCGSRMG